MSAPKKTPQPAALVLVVAAIAVVPLSCRRSLESGVDRDGGVPTVDGAAATDAPAVPMAIALECPALASQVPVEPKPFVLNVTAADIVGNKVVFRHPFRVVPQEPEVRFTELGTPRDVRGGTKLEVRWETRLVLPEAPVVKIDFSEDGGASWSSLVDDFPNEGRWTWSVPGVDLRGGLLRITVRRDTGQEAVAVSAPLTISTTVPRVVIDHIEAGPRETGPREAGPTEAEASEALSEE